MAADRDDLAAQLMALCDDVLALLHKAPDRESAMTVLIDVLARWTALMAGERGDQDVRRAMLFVREHLQRETVDAFERMKGDFRSRN